MMAEDLRKRRSKDDELLMIPGPVNFDCSVLSEMRRKTESHTSHGFISTFGETLKALRKVFLTAKSEMVVTAGSGTTAMEMALVNLIEKGDEVLVVSHGFFVDRFVKILNSHDIQPHVISAEWGQRVSPETFEAKLESRDFKAITVTQVDTSTGILAPVKEFGKSLGKRNTLLIVDGVSSVGGQEFRMDDWNVDVCITASQKAIGVPPGLAIISVGERALEAWKNRNSPVEC